MCGYHLDMLFYDRTILWFLTLWALHKSIMYNKDGLITEDCEDNSGWSLFFIIAALQVNKHKTKKPTNF